MITLLRMTAVVLVLSTSGVVHALDSVIDGQDACADEAADEAGDCSEECGLCFCCPVRAAPADVAMSSTVERVVDCVVNEPPLFAGSSGAADIFRPPRA